MLDIIFVRRAVIVMVVCWGVVSVYGNKVRTDLERN
jgi:hypothetical protein